MAPLTKQKQIVGLVGWLMVSFIAAAIGGAASIQAGPLYTRLVRPDWAAFSQHGFLGKESETVEEIVNWMLKKPMREEIK
jgi:hypothetical protein